MEAAGFWLLASVMLQGALALGLLWYLGAIRVPLITRGDVKIGAIALSREPWPEREKKVSNAFDNQFQVPVLFFVAAIVAINTGAGAIDAALGWVFVLSRFAHAFIHVTDNHVIRRFWVFTFGLAALSLLWLMIAVRLVVAALAFGLH